MTTEDARATALAEVLGAVRELGGRAPGTRLRADDWNALVDTMARVARLPAAPGGTAGPSDLPPGSVGFDELDADLQRLLRSGPFADPRSAGVQRELGRRLGAIEGRLGGLEGRLDGLLAAVHRAETEVARGRNHIELVDHRVAGAVALKGEVGDLRTLLGSVRADVGEALAVRDDLAGVEVGALAGTVRELVRFRDAWRDESDQPLTFSALSTRLGELRSATVTDTELASVLDARLANIDVDTGAIRTSVLNDLRTELANGRDELRADIDVRLTSASGALRAELDAEVARSVGASSATLAGSLRDIAAEVTGERLRDVEVSVRGDVTRIVDDRLAGLDVGVGAAELEALEGRLSADIRQVRESTVGRGALDDAIDASQKALTSRIDALDARVGGRFDAVVRSEAELAATLRRERADAAAAEGRRLEGVLAEASRREAVERVGAIDAAVGRVTADLTGRLDTARRELIADRDAAITRVLDTAVAGLRATLEARLRVVANDAVAAVEADLAAVRAEMTRIDTRVVDIDRRVVTRPVTGGTGLIVGTGGSISDRIRGSGAMDRPERPG